MNSRKILQGLVFFFASLLGFIFLFHLLIPSAQPILTASDYQKNKAQSFSYIAIGDSLTQGVGDTTNQGGFVPLLAQSLTNTYGYQVMSANYGVSGNTSEQILKRMQENTEISDALAQANLMTLTVGGNDLRKAILANITDLQVDTFTKPAETYKEHLLEIISEARKNNPNLPIYVVGIYNPFYLSFPELTEMQTVVNNWNQTTEEAIKGLDNVYFVPINDLISQGTITVPSSSSSAANSVSSVLSKDDNFHPNNTGYEIIKKAIMEKISETKEKWEN